jgi:hypothetical protein
VPINLGDQQWIVLVADGDTPPALTGYAGRIVGVPAGVQLPPLGTLDSITVGAVTVHGYLRPAAGGTLEWVMAAPLNPTLVAVNAIPSTGAWTDLAARQVYYSIGQVLLGVGVTGADLRTGLKALYDAAVADAVAAVAAGKIPAPPGPGAIAGP